MDITTVAKTAEYAVSSLDGILEDKPTGLSRVLLAYAPSFIRNFLIQGRLRLIHLRHNEEVIEESFKILKMARNKIIESSLENDYDPLARIKLNQIEKDYRLLNTIHLALPYIEESTEKIEPHFSESDVLWWDMFEELASRRNEPWRVNLFARSVAINDSKPGMIGFKALWEIAMMETEDFSALSIFCDSSLYVDGKPICLMEPEEQYSYELDLDDIYKGNLALCINRLIDKNLIQKVATQFMTTDDIELVHQEGITFMTHSINGVDGDVNTAIRIEGFAPTDHCLDICKLYTPKLNIASERNFSLFKEQLLDDSIQDDDGHPESSFSFR